MKEKLATYKQSYVINTRTSDNKDVISALSPWRASRWRRYGLFFQTFYTANPSYPNVMMKTLLTSDCTNRVLRECQNWFRFVGANFVLIPQKVTPTAQKYIPSARNRNINHMTKKPTSSEKTAALKIARNATNSPNCSFRRIPKNFLYKYKSAAADMLRAALNGASKLKVGGTGGDDRRAKGTYRNLVETIMNHHLALDINDASDPSVLDVTIYKSGGVSYTPLLDMRMTRYPGPDGRPGRVSTWLRFISGEGEYIRSPYNYNLFRPSSCFERTMTSIFISLLANLPNLKRRFKIFPSTQFDINPSMATAVCDFFLNSKISSGSNIADIIKGVETLMKRPKTLTTDGIKKPPTNNVKLTENTNSEDTKANSTKLIQVVYNADGFVVKKKSDKGVTTHYLVQSPSKKFFEISNTPGSVKLLFNYTLHAGKYFIDNDALTCDGRRFGSFNDGFCWLGCFATQNKYIPYALKVRPYVTLQLLFKCGLSRAILNNIHFVSSGVCHFDSSKKSTCKKFFMTDRVMGKMTANTKPQTVVFSRPVYTKRAIAANLNEFIARRVVTGRSSATIRFDPVTTRGTIYVYKQDHHGSKMLLNGVFRSHVHPTSRETALNIEYNLGGRGSKNYQRKLRSHVYATRTNAEKLISHYFSSLFLSDKIACDTYNMCSRKVLIRSDDDVERLGCRVWKSLLESLSKPPRLERPAPTQRETTSTSVPAVRQKAPTKPSKAYMHEKVEKVVTKHYTRLSSSVTITEEFSSNADRHFIIDKCGKTVLKVRNHRDSFRRIFNYLITERIFYIPKLSQNFDGVYMMKNSNAYCWLRVFYDNHVEIPTFIKIRPYIPVYLVTKALNDNSFLKHVKPTSDGYCHYSTSYYGNGRGVHSGMYLGGNESDEQFSGHADELDSKVDMLVDKLLTKFTPRSDNLAFTAITNEVTRKFEAWTHRPFDVDVNTCLTSKERKILGELYPEYKLNFLSKSFSSHALFTAIRTLENFHLNKMCGHKNFLDFGGNLTTHILSKVSDTHLCLPNVDIKDSVRKINNKLFLSDLCRDTKNITVCSHKAQDCSVHKRRAVMVEVYDMSLNDMCRAIISHDCDRLDFTMLLPGELLAEFSEINVYDNACVISREGDVVKYRYGQCGETYTHSLKNLRDIMTRVVCSVDGVLFKKTIENNRGPIVHMSLCPINSIESGIKTYESVYVAHESNLVKMFIPKFDERGFAEDVEIVLDKSLVMHMIEFSANCIENLNRKSFEQLMSQFRSRKGYIIYNNKVIQENIELDQSELEGFLGVIWGCGMRIAEKTRYSARYIYNSYYAPSLVELFLNFVRRTYQRFSSCCYKGLLRVLRYLFGENAFPDHISSQGRIVNLDKVYVATQKITLCNNVISEDFFPQYYERYVEASNQIIKKVCDRMDSIRTPPPGFEHVINSGGGMVPSRAFNKIYEYVSSCITDREQVAKLTVKLATIYDGIRVGVINANLLTRFNALTKFFEKTDLSGKLSYGWNQFKTFVVAIFKFLLNPVHYVYRSVKRLCKYVMAFLVGPGGLVVNTTNFEAFLSCYPSDDEDEIDDLYDALVDTGVDPKVAAEVYTGENPEFYRQYLADGGLRTKYIERILSSGGGSDRTAMNPLSNYMRRVIKNIVSMAKTSYYKLVDLISFLFFKCKVLLMTGYRFVTTKASKVFLCSSDESVEVVYDGGWLLKPVNLLKKYVPRKFFSSVHTKVQIYYLRNKLEELKNGKEPGFIMRLLEQVVSSGGGSPQDVFWSLINFSVATGYLCKTVGGHVLRTVMKSTYALGWAKNRFVDALSYIFGTMSQLSNMTEVVGTQFSEMVTTLVKSLRQMFEDLESGDPNTIVSGISSAVTIITLDLIDVFKFRDVGAVLRLCSSLLSPLISMIVSNIYPVIDNVLLLPILVCSRTLSNESWVRSYIRKLGFVCCVKGMTLSRMLKLSPVRTMTIQYHASLLISTLHSCMRSPMVRWGVVAATAFIYISLGGGFGEAILISTSIYRYFSTLRIVTNVANISIASDVDIDALSLPNDMVRICEDLLKKKFHNANITHGNPKSIEPSSEEVGGVYNNCYGESDSITPSRSDPLFFRDPQGVNNLRGYEEPKYRDDEKRELIVDMRNEMCSILRDYPFSTLTSFVSTSNPVENAYNEYIHIEKTNISTNLGKLEDVVKHYHVGYNTPEKLRPLFDDANLFMFVKGIGWKCLSTRASGSISDPKFIFTVDKTIVEKLCPSDEVAFSTREFEVGYANKKLFRLENATFHPESVTQKILNLERNGKLKIINKPPGSGKTTTISKIVVELFDREKDFLVLSVTKAGRNELVEKIKNLREGFPVSKVKTIESVLMNGAPAIIGHLIIDECFMAHCGQIVSIINFGSTSEVSLFGDVNQIPYICRIPYVTTRYATTLFNQAVWEFDDSTYRCPADVCYLLSNQTDIRGNKIYPSGVIAKRNPRLRTMSVTEINGIEDIESIEDPDTVYMTYTQAEKYDVLKALKVSNVFTVNEVQGRTVKHVKLVRLRGYANDIYNNQHQFVTAISRHTETFNYFIPSNVVADKVKNEVGALNTIADFAIAAFGFRQSV
nr:polyprotein [Agapanthus velarivirus]